MIEAVGLGMVVIDQQMVVERYPDPNTKVAAAGMRQQVGAPVPTAMVAAARLGTRCGFIGNWAGDSAGQFIDDDFRREQIDTRYCPRSAHTTGVAHVWVDQSNAARTVVHVPGDRSDVALEDITKFFSQPDSSSIRLLHLDGTSGPAALAAAKAVKSNGGIVTLDTGSPKSATAELIGLAEVVNCPAYFGEKFFDGVGGEVGEQWGSRLLEMGAGSVVVTNGEQGGRVFETNQTTYQFEAFPVQAVDTTGAGDVFCGGLIRALLDELPLIEAVRFAAAAAALKCQHLGNRGALPTREQVEQMLRR